MPTDVPCRVSIQESQLRARPLRAWPVTRSDNTTTIVIVTIITTALTGDGKLRAESQSSMKQLATPIIARKVSSMTSGA